MLTLNGPQASASGVRAARWLIALPVVMLLFHLLLWLRYGTDLRAITQGRGVYAIEFDHYDPVPSHLTAGIVTQHKEEEEHE